MTRAHVITGSFGIAAEDSAFRRDSRLEIVLGAAPTEEFLNAWRTLLRDAANPPRIDLNRGGGTSR